MPTDGTGPAGPRGRIKRRGKHFVTPDIMLRERPVEVDARKVPGHREGDLIVGLSSSAMSTLVERATRCTMLPHLPRMDTYGQPWVKGGPVLAGHAALLVRDAITAPISALPEQLRRSLTWDPGAEMAQHAQLRIDTNQNTNRPLCQNFLKGTDLVRHCEHLYSLQSTRVTALD